MTPSTLGCHGDQVFTPSTESVGAAAKEGEELAPPPGELAPPPVELAPPPGEMALFLVLQYLSTLELLMVGGVSRQWRRVSRHSSLWKQVEMKDVMLPAQVGAALNSLLVAPSVLSPLVVRPLPPLPSPPRCRCWRQWLGGARRRRPSNSTDCAQSRLTLMKTCRATSSGRGEGRRGRGEGRRGRGERGGAEVNMQGV